MSLITYDGYTLASDSIAISSGSSLSLNNVQKIFPVNDLIVGITGSIMFIHPVLKYLRALARYQTSDEFPEIPRCIIKELFDWSRPPPNEIEFHLVIVNSKTRRVGFYSENYLDIIQEPGPFAQGAWADRALLDLRSGVDPREVIHRLSKDSRHLSNPVHYVTIDNIKNKNFPGLPPLSELPSKNNKVHDGV